MEVKSSLRGLRTAGPLCGHDQVVISAGEGAAALDIKKGYWRCSAAYSDTT